MPATPTFTAGSPVPDEVSALSIQEVKVPVTALLDGTAYDPSAGTVQLAFAAPGSNPTTWLAGTWEPTPNAMIHDACVLAGANPGLDQLTAGTWDVWVKIADTTSSQTVVINAGPISVY